MSISLLHVGIILLAPKQFLLLGGLTRWVGAINLVSFICSSSNLIFDHTCGQHIPQWLGTSSQIIHWPSISGILVGSGALLVFITFGVSLIVEARKKWGSNALKPRTNVSVSSVVFCSLEWDCLPFCICARNGFWPSLFTSGIDGPSSCSGACLAFGRPCWHFPVPSVVLVILSCATCCFVFRCGNRSPVVVGTLLCRLLWQNY